MLVIQAAPTLIPSTLLHMLDAQLCGGFNIQSLIALSQAKTKVIAISTELREVIAMINLLKGTHVAKYQYTIHSPKNTL